MVVTVRTKAGNTEDDTQYRLIEDEALTAQLPANDGTWDIRSGLIPLDVSLVGGWKYKLTLIAPDEATATMRGLKVFADTADLVGGWNGIYATAETVGYTTTGQQRWSVTIVRQSVQVAQQDTAIDPTGLDVVAGTEHVQAIVRVVLERLDQMGYDVEQGEISSWDETMLLDAVLIPLWDLGYTSYGPKAIHRVANRQAKALAFFALDDAVNDFHTLADTVVAILWSLAFSGVLTHKDPATRRDSVYALLRELESYILSNRYNASSVIYASWMPWTIDSVSDVDTSDEDDLLDEELVAMRYSGPMPARKFVSDQETTKIVNEEPTVTATPSPEPTIGVYLELNHVGDLSIINAGGAVLAGAFNRHEIPTTVLDELMDANLAVLQARLGVLKSVESAIRRAAVEELAASTAPGHRGPARYSARQLVAELERLEHEVRRTIFNRGVAATEAQVPGLSLLLP